MDILTMIVGGALTLLLASFVLRLSYTILRNLINGQDFHHSLEREFNRLRLSNMFTALGINKRKYIYQTRVGDVRQHMESCKACENTNECDEKLSTEGINPADILFCNNEATLIKIKQQQAE